MIVEAAFRPVNGGHTTTSTRSATSETRSWTLVDEDRALARRRVHLPVARDHRRAFAAHGWLLRLSRDACGPVGAAGSAGIRGQASSSAARPGNSALEQLHRGAAAGRDERDALLEVELLERGDRVAAADDRDRAVVAADRDRDLLGAVLEGRHLEHAHRAVPEDRLAVGDRALEQLDGRGTDIEPHHVGGDLLAADDAGLGVGGDCVGDDEVDRQHEVDALARAPWRASPWPARPSPARRASRRRRRPWRRGT